MVVNTNFLFENNKNYIYKINDENFILFNPVIQSWIALDYIGKEIVEAIQKNKNIEDSVQALSKKFHIADDEIYNDVKPFVDELIAKRFFLNERPEYEKTWMEKEFSVSDIRKIYPLNDIYIGITDACNLNCIYCFNHENRYTRLKSNLSNMGDAEVFNIIKQYKELGGKGVVFTGGEPTLNPHLVNYARYAIKSGLVPRMITNGTNLLNIDLKELLRYMNDISISLDSVIIEELTKLWNVDCRNKLNDLFEALEIIDNISKDSNKPVNIVISPIVSRVNIGSICKVIKYAKEKLSNCNVRWNFTPYGKIGKNEIDEALSVTPDEYYINYLEAWRKSVPAANDMMLKYFASTEGGKRELKKRPNFVACTPAFFVNNKGFIYPCQGLENEEHLLGNINNVTLKEAYESAIMDNVIKSAMISNYNKCSECELRFLCTLKNGACSKNDEVYKCKERMHTIMFYKSKFNGSICGNKSI